MKPPEIRSWLQPTFARLQELTARPHRQPATEEVGRVRSLAGGIALVDGLPSVGIDEVVELGGQTLGMVMTLAADEVGVVLLDPEAQLQAGARARRTGRVVDLPVGPALLGRVVDPLGRALDGGAALPAQPRAPVEAAAPAIMERAPVNRPLQTGIKVVDALLPIGRGQRELIVGDRQTGKTSLALDAILNQRESGVVCVYCSVGQRDSGVARVLAELRQHGALDYSCLVVAASEDPPGLRFLAPYAATSVAEWFMRQGQDVLIVYDDLTHHALAYRELSLLLRRPPGREAFPGDIFYIHSRLLERSTQLRPELGGGSLTALPIVSTEAQNLAAYIPTNLISITDGQLVTSPTLFQKGILPAIEVGRSVSRVGGQAQLPAYRAVTSELRLEYAQFEELEAFARFDTRLSEDTLRTLERGRRVREILKQPRYGTLDVTTQIAVMLTATEGLLDALPLDQVSSAESALHRAFGQGLAHLRDQLTRGAELGLEDRHAILELATQTLEAACGP